MGTTTAGFHHGIHRILWQPFTCCWTPGAAGNSGSDCSCFSVCKYSCTGNALLKIIKRHWTHWDKSLQTSKWPFYDILLLAEVHKEICLYMIFNFFFQQSISLWSIYCVLRMRWNTVWASVKKADIQRVQPAKSVFLCQLQWNKWEWHKNDSFTQLWELQWGSLRKFSSWLWQ